MSLLRVPIKPPITAPWKELVKVTTVASTGSGCFTSQVLNPVSNSWYLASNWVNGLPCVTVFGAMFTTITPCFPSVIFSITCLYNKFLQKPTKILEISFASLSFSCYEERLREVLTLREMRRKEIDSVLSLSPLKPPNKGFFQQNPHLQYLPGSFLICLLVHLLFTIFNMGLFVLFLIF